MGILADVALAVGTIADSMEESAEQYCAITDRIVSGYTDDLDSIMARIKVDVIDCTPSDTALEMYALELNNAIYFLGERLEKMGVRDDVSKLASKEAYNDAYLKFIDESNEKKLKRTVAELTAMAEDESKYNAVMNAIYARAYKQIKFKIDASIEMVGTLKKVISRRMAEKQLSMMGSDQ